MIQSITFEQWVAIITCNFEIVCAWYAYVVIKENSMI